MSNLPDFCSILTSEIDERINRLSPERYSQEPAYMGALISKLDDVFYSDTNYSLEIKGVVVADRGPNSAERRTGADFSIIVIINRNGNIITKAILGQAKKGDQLTIKPGLQTQINKMKQFTRDILIAQTPGSINENFSVRIYNSESNSLSESMPLSQYFCMYLLACIHGDLNNEFIERVQNSNLNRLEIRFTTQ